MKWSQYLLRDVQWFVFAKTPKSLTDYKTKGCCFIFGIEVQTDREEIWSNLYIRWIVNCIVYFSICWNGMRLTNNKNNGRSSIFHVISRTFVLVKSSKNRIEYVKSLLVICLISAPSEKYLIHPVIAVACLNIRLGSLNHFD